MKCLIGEKEYFLKIFFNTLFIYFYLGINSVLMLICFITLEKSLVVYILALLFS